MAREHEDTPAASGAIIWKNHARGRNRAKKQPQEPFASNYGQVPFTKVPAGSLTEEGDLGEAAVGRSAVFFGTVRAIRPVSNTMAAVVLQRRNLSNERCVVVAGAFAGITTRMVRFATTLSRQSLVIVDGVVSLSKSTQQVEILVKKLHSISFSDPTYPIKLDDAARSDENVGTWKDEQACPLCRLRNEREGDGAFQSY